MSTHPFDQPGGMSQVAVPQDQFQAQNTGYSIQQAQGMANIAQGAFIGQAQNAMQQGLANMSNQMSQAIVYTKEYQEKLIMDKFLQQCEELTKETKE